MISPSCANGVGGRAGWQWHHQDAGSSPFDLREFMPSRIECRGDPGVGGAQQRQPFLHRAHAGRLKVLAGAARIAEPGVVGDVDQPGGAVGRGPRSRLERSPRSRSSGPTGGAPATCSVRGPGPRANPPPGTTWMPSGEPIRLVFPERHEVPLVIHAVDRARIGQREQAVARPIVAVEADRADQRRGTARRLHDDPRGPADPAQEGTGNAVSGQTTTAGPAAGAGHAFPGEVEVALEDRDRAGRGRISGPPRRCPAPAPRAGRAPGASAGPGGRCRTPPRRPAPRRRRARQRRPSAGVSASRTVSA